MNTVKIRSYNAKRAEMFGKKLSSVDKIILLRSEPHTHTELQFSDQYANISFSATMADGAKCARFKQISYSHAERWDTVDIEVTSAEEHLMWDEANRIKGTPYDLVGLLSTISKHNIIKPSEKAVWCTETVNMLVCMLPQWKSFLDALDMPMELIPCEMDMLARHFFK